MPFSPATYLTEQGWEGKGHGLRKGSIRKPLTVAHKTNLAGLGKERDTGYAWWDDVFSLVANKTKTPESSNASSREGSAVADIRKTSTGIYSPRPPGHLSNGAYPASGSATPAQTPSTSTSAAFNADIIAQAKLEAARRELYSKFLRGRPLAGTADDDSDDGGKAAPDASLSHSSKAVQEASAPSDESQKAQDKTERRILRAEKKALKEQKRAAKEARRKGKGVAEPLGDEEAGEPVGTALDIPDNAEDQPDVLSEPASRKSKKRKVRDRDIEVGTTTIQEIDAAPAEDAPPDKPPSKTKVKRSKAEKAAQKRSKLEEL